jgi:Fur family transcriptional regulator, ferric uptake regulator
MSDSNLFLQISRNNMYNCNMIDKLKVKLQQHGYSLTKPRLTVFGALQSPVPRSMRQLVVSLEGIVDRASIYRTVALFEELGIAVRVQQGWKYKLELSDDFTPHHHHVSCTNCQRVISFDEPKELIEILNGLAATHGFALSGHTLEIQGLCPECQLLAKN